MKEQLALLPEYLTAHLQLTLAALLLGIAFSVPLGILAHRIKWIEQPVLSIASIIQTIPALALLAIMVPLLAALHLRSIGFLPAFLALVLYGILPVLRNTVTGLASVDPALCEAARGVGMTPNQQLTQIEIPLAMPVIIAGIRTASVWTVGMATLSTPVGAPSLGNYIFSGLQTRNYYAVFVGCIAAALLAMLLDQLIRLLSIGFVKKNRLFLATGAILLGLLCLYSVGTLAAQTYQSFQQETLQTRIGAKAFTEQYILSELLKEQIETKTDQNAEVISSLGSTVVFDALRLNEIDIYIDYSGTIWATIMKRESVPDRKAVLEEVKTFLQKEYGILLIGTLGFENAYALAMRREQAKELGISKISDLRRFDSQMTIGGDYEFFSRTEWKALQNAYGLSFQEQKTMDPSLMYQAAAQKEVDVISAFSTDGRIAAFDLLVLEDDRGAIPPYDAILLASKRAVKESPDVIQALEGLLQRIDAKAMRQMNMDVDEKGKTPKEVAKKFFQTLESK